MESVLVTGSNGMLGSAVCAALESKGIIPVKATRKSLDLSRPGEVLKKFKEIKPSSIIHCAAVVGGIQANVDGKTKFFTENIKIDTSVINAARELQIENLIYIGSSCMYPANREEALTENNLLTGELEPSNKSYALAKIFGTELVSSIALEDGLKWRTFIASNLYGPGDHFDPVRSHLLAAVIQKVLKAKAEGAKEISMWGSGTGRREFTFVEDFANWIASSLEKLEDLPLVLNTGIGVDFTILEFYKLVMEECGLDAKVVPDLTKPDGNRRKLMDSSLARQYGWNPETDIKTGISKTVEWFEAQPGSSN